LIVRVVRLAALKFSGDGASMLAQAIAFNACFATIPFALVLSAMFGFIYGSGSGDAAALGAIDTFAPAMRDIVAQNLPTVVRSRNLSGLVGLAALVWSAKNVFQTLGYALDRALGITKSRHVVWETIIAVVLVPIACGALILASAIPVVISVIVRLPGLRSLRDLPEVASYATSIAVVFVISALLYTFLPNRKFSDVRFGLPGALVTAAGWSIAQVGFAIYTTHTNILHVYGVVSTVFALLLYVYILAAIFLFGAHVSAAVERETAPPDEDLLA